MGDDFVWFQIADNVKQLSDLPQHLFKPLAQGTVRFLSERSFFLIFHSLFGMEALPLRLTILAALMLSSVLLAEVSRKLTGSAITGVLAVFLWCVQIGLLTAVSWISAANQIFCALFILAALVAFIHKRIILCWTIYLLGFGILETNVVFPAILGTYCFLFERTRFRKTLLFWIPSIIFILLRMLVFRNAHAGSEYQLLIASSDLWFTLKSYLAWLSQPLIIGWMVAYTAWRAYRKDFSTLFAVSLFLLMLAPILPLRNHILQYYLAAPGLGFGLWLAFCFENLRRPDLPIRGIQWLALPLILIIGFFHLEEIPESRKHILNWYRATFQDIRVTMENIRDIRLQDTKAILIQGLAPETFLLSVMSDFSGKLSSKRVFFLEEHVKTVPDFRKTGFKERLASASLIQTLMEDQDAQFFEIRNHQWLKTDQPGESIDLNNYPEYSSFVALGEPGYRNHLTGNWYPSDENGLRAIQRKAGVILNTQSMQTGSLNVSGYCSGAYYRAGNPGLEIQANQKPIGIVHCTGPDSTFEINIQLPHEFQGQKKIYVDLIADSSNQDETQPPESILIREVFVHE